MKEFKIVFNHDFTHPNVVGDKVYSQGKNYVIEYNGEIVFGRPKEEIKCISKVEERS